MGVITQWGDDEDGALQGLPHLSQLLYLRCLRRFMDYETGVVGLTRRVSYQMFREALYVEPVPGRNIKDRDATVQVFRSAVAQLERVGLVEPRSTDRQLIFFLPLAARDQSGQNRNNRGTTEEQQTSDNRPNRPPNMGFRGDEQQRNDRPKGGEEQQSSGFREPEYGPPPNARARDEAVGANRDGLPACIPRPEWEAYQQEQALNGRPLSLGQVLACWQELVRHDADGYDPGAMLRRATAGGFRTFDRRPETQKPPATSQGAPGASSSKRGHYATNQRIDNSAPARSRRAIAARQVARGETPDYDPATGEPFGAPGKAAPARSAPVGVGGRDPNHGGDGGDVIDLGPADYRAACR